MREVVTTPRPPAGGDPGSPEPGAPTPVDGPTRPVLAPAPVWARGVLLALTVMAFVGSLWSLGHVYPNLTSNNDEAVYLFQAEMYRGGELTLPLDQAVLTRPWMSGEQEGRLIMVFPPTWPLVLAGSLLVSGSADGATALVVALLVPATYLLVRRVARDPVTGLVGAGVLVASPFVLIHGATRLSYLFALLLEVVVAWLVVRAADDGWRRGGLIGAGVACGVLFSARPFDTLLVSSAMVVLVVVAVWSSGPAPLGARIARLARIAGWVALGALGPVLAVLAYNAALSGNPLRFPLHAVGGENAFGFGPRTIVDGAPVFDVTPELALTSARLNLGELPHWLWGSVAVLPLVGWGFVLVHRRNRPVFWGLAALTLVIPAGFVLYWGNVLIVQGRAELGPHYYLALLVPFAATVAMALVELARRAGTLVAVGVAVALTLLTIAVELPPKYERADRVTASSSADLDAIAAAARGGPVAVIVPASPDGSWILHPRGHLANQPDLGGDVVYVAEEGPITFGVFDRFPGRRVLRLTGRQPDSLMTRAPDAQVEEVHVERAPSFDVTQEVVNVDGAPVVAVYAQTPTGGVQCVVDAASVPGRRYELHWWFDGRGVLLEPPCAGAVSLLGADPDGALVLGASFGATADIAAESRVDARMLSRVHDGQVELLLPPEVRRFDRGEVRPFDTTHLAEDARQRVQVQPSTRTSPLG